MNVTSAPPSPQVSMPDRREALREELERTRTLFFDLASQTNGSNWNNQSGNPAWTVGNVMGHIVMVFGAIPMKMERLRKGKGIPGLPKFLFDPLNSVSTRMATRKYNPDNIRTAYDEAHQKALATLEGIQDHEWELAARFFGEHQDTAELFHYHAKHVREHEPDVRAGT
jgi:hypothetical protein